MISLSYMYIYKYKNQINETKYKKHIAKCVQFSWSLFLSIHVIQFLVVRADLCPIQMTPPRYHVAMIKHLLLHVSYLSSHAFMRTYVSE